MNWFGYVGNNPVNIIDRTGLEGQRLSTWIQEQLVKEHEEKDKTHYPQGMDEYYNKQNNNNTPNEADMEMLANWDFEYYLPLEIPGPEPRIQMTPNPEIKIYKEADRLNASLMATNPSDRKKLLTDIFKRLQKKFGQHTNNPWEIDPSAPIITTPGSMNNVILEKSIMIDVALDTRTGCDFTWSRPYIFFSWFQSTHPHGVRPKIKIFPSGT